jgi:hypothetical protein
MRVANAETLQNAKLAEKPKPPEPPVKKEVAVVPTAISVTSSLDGEERTFRCEHEGCASSFRTRSSLRDHQKGEKVVGS